MTKQEIIDFMKSKIEELPKEAQDAGHYLLNEWLKSGYLHINEYDEPCDDNWCNLCDTIFDWEISCLTKGKLFQSCKLFNSLAQ